LAAARGGALILGEGAHLTVAALPAGSFRHGPLELAGPGHVALIFAPNSPTRPLLDRLVTDLLPTGSRVILLAEGAPPADAPNLMVLPVTGSPGEAYFLLPAALLIERLLLAVARRRGLVPGRFQYSGKITDRE